MELPSRLRLGCVKYLNAQPLIHGWPGPVHFDAPSALSAQLVAGTLDVALVPSLEFLRRPLYKIVNGLSIACAGPVHSVFLAYTGRLEMLQIIEADPASQTSISLLRALLAEYYDVVARTIPAPSDDEQPITRGKGRLLIGDRAIRFRERFASAYHYLDLGAEWFRRTSWPFVFALWLVRPDYPEATLVADALRAQCQRNLLRLDEVIAAQPEFDPAFCAFYFRECLRYSLGVAEKAGLRKFHELCQTRGQLPMRAASMEFV